MTRALLASFAIAALALFGLCLAGLKTPPAFAEEEPMSEPEDTTPLRHTVLTIEGKKQPLKAFRGKALLIVNTASECGYTRHYAGLQELHERYAKRGLVVLGFPCNQFGGQEPGTEAQIKAFCEQTFKVKFPLFAKVEVLPGEAQAPLFKSLTSEGPEATRGKIKWNFEKFLLDPSGKVVARWKSGTDPLDPKLIAALEAALPKVSDGEGEQGDGE